MPLEGPEGHTHTSRHGLTVLDLPEWPRRATAREQRKIMAADPERGVGHPRASDSYSVLESANQDSEIFTELDSELHRAIRDHGGVDYLRTLLQAGAGPNRVNPVQKKAPLHVAVEVGNAAALEALLLAEDIDVNIQDDQGFTALHAAAQSASGHSAHYRCVEMLMRHPQVAVNMRDRQGLTPLHRAAKHAPVDLVRFLLVEGGRRLDVDCSENAEKETARQLIANKHPSLAWLLPPRAYSNPNVIEINETTLFYHLEKGETGAFGTALGKTSSLNVDADNGEVTLLQLASKEGLVDAVSALLKRGADPNRTSPSNSRSPLMLAVMGVTKAARAGLATSRASGDHRKCVQLLLAKGVDVNEEDSKGSTALHYAVRSSDSDLVVALLEKGAFIAKRNNHDEMPLYYVAPSTLETYLDKCVTTNDSSPHDDNYQLIFRYDLLVAPPKVNHEVRGNNDPAKRFLWRRPPVMELELLHFMGQSRQLRHLLTHPIIRSFLYLKWQRIRPVFMFQLFCYIACTLLFILYVTIGDLLDHGYFSDQSDQDDVAALAITVVITFTQAAELFRNLFRLIMSPSDFLFNLESWMELTLIAITAALLLTPLTIWRHELAAIAILLSLAELVVVLGRTPEFATYVEMFKTVSLKYLKFFALYSLLILAFALSFFILFHDCDGDTEACKEDNGEDLDANLFRNFFRSLFKTIVMMTGEFDADSMPFKYSSVTSHILFVVFIFFITIVLFNLLNGLAVSDTQEIQKNAKVHAYVSRVKMLNYAVTLRVLLGDSFGRQIHVLPNMGNFIQFSSNSDKTSRGERVVQKVHRFMGASVVRDAYRLLKKREAETEVSQMQKTIDHFERENQTYRQQLRDLLEILKDKKGAGS